MQTVVKSFDGSLTLDEGSRTVLAVISTDSVDREGEVVNPKGMHKKNFSSNPIVLLNHNKAALPIGKALWVKADTNEKGRGVIKSKYRITDKTEEGRAVWDLMKEGILTSHSISFLSNYATKPTTKEINERPDLQDARLIHRDWELLEFSVVTIPCNPDAVAVALSKGYSDKIVSMFGAAKEGKAPEPAEQTKQQTSDFNKELVEAARRVKISVDLERAIAVAMGRF